LICPNAEVTFLIAILLALGVPFATLHTDHERVTCCCPDPDHCMCPDHKPDKSGQPHMQTCHRQLVDGVDAQLATFVPAAPTVIADAAPHALVVEYVLPSPHASPSLRRPDAPS